MCLYFPLLYNIIIVQPVRDCRLYLYISNSFAGLGETYRFLLYVRSTLRVKSMSWPRKAALRFGNTEASTSDHLLCLSTGATESALPARVLLNSSPPQTYDSSEMKHARVPTRTLNNLPV